MPRRKTRTHRIILIAGAVLTPALCTAAPLVFEETAKITSPDPAYFFPYRLAVDGDAIIATGRKFVGEIEHHTAFLFRRQSNGTWAYDRILATTSCDSGEIAEDTCNASVAMRNGVAIVSAGSVHVFVRAADGSWVEASSNGFSGPGEAAVGTNTVAASESVSCSYATNAFKRNASGVWSLAAKVPGPSFPGCDPWGLIGSEIDLSTGNRLIVGGNTFQDDVQIYEPNATGWTQAANLTAPVSGNNFGGAVALDDSRAFVSGTFDAPIHVYTRGTGGWTHGTDIVSPDSEQHAWPLSLKVSGLVMGGFASDPHRGGSVGVYQQNSSGEYRQVARLVGSDSASRQTYLGEELDGYVNGSFARIATSDASGGLYVFDLNRWGTTPAPRLEDFEFGNAANWTPIAGSAFTVVTSGGSKVYRQSSVTGDAGSHVTSLDWTDQAIEADVKPTAFDGANRWVGLAVRRTNASNYYYVTLRQANLIELKRMLNGSFVTLASKPIPVTLNRNYRLRIEVVGTLVRAYVDGSLMVQARDTSLTHGHAGIQMYRARADYDNVILSQNPHLTLLDQHKFLSFDDRWNVGPGAWSEDTSSGNQRLIQQSTSGDARAVNRVPADDQIVQVRAAATQFAAGTGSRWFGVMARYVDAGNYYYVTLRNDNTVSLRKLVNGVIHVLDSAPFTVAAGTSYGLRLETVGTSLRAYVNGNLLLEATDASHVRGKYGPVMYKAAATYQDFLVWEP